MAKKYITAVFEYEDGAELPSQITKAFAQNERLGGCKVTAVSSEDEISRCEKLEEQLGNC
jgi:hypothetical protein